MCETVFLMYFPLLPMCLPQASQAFRGKYSVEGTVLPNADCEVSPRVSFALQLSWKWKHVSYYIKTYIFSKKVANQFLPVQTDGAFFGRKNAGRQHHRAYVLQVPDDDAASSLSARCCPCHIKECVGHDKGKGNDNVRESCAPQSKQSKASQGWPSCP